MSINIYILSNELLHDIIQFVGLPRPFFVNPPKGCKATEDLVSILLCSRRFKSVAEPILYGKLVQKTGKGLPKFIRTILGRPTLAQHVRTVQITDIPSPISYLSSIFGSEEMGFIHALGQTYIGSRHAVTTWIGAIKSGRWDALTALVLVLLPNVEALQIDSCKSNMESPKTYLNILFSRAATPQNQLDTGVNLSALTKLHKIAISYAKRQVVEESDACIPLIKHGSLKTFEGDMMGDIGQGISLGKPLGLTLGLTSLRIERSNLSILSLQDLLSCCPFLERLMYEHDQNREEEPFSPRKFGIAIAHLNSCLQELVLYRTDMRGLHGYGPRPASTEELTLVKTLTAFEKLTKISMSADLLLGPQKSENLTHRRFAHANGGGETQKLAEGVPKCLEELYLKNCGNQVMQHVCALLEYKNLVTPNLKRVTLEFVDRNSSHYFGGFVDRAWRQQHVHLAVNQKEIEKLEAECKANGVVLEILYN